MDHNLKKVIDNVEVINLKRTIRIPLTKLDHSTYTRTDLQYNECYIQLIQPFTMY